MRIEKRNLWKDYALPPYGKPNFEPTLTAYIIDNTIEINPDKRRPGILICPGGAYEYTSAREADPVMIKYLSAGFNVFILHYSVAPAIHPQPLLDLSRAICMIRENAEVWHTHPDQIAVCGFSAGGHLAASLGVFWNAPFLKEITSLPEGMNKPNALILCYPVISAGAYAHRGSFENLLGKDSTPEKLSAVSLENHVNPQTPPAFLWHTLSDDLVPAENSLLFAQNLKKLGIPFELHIFPYGPHGLSTCDKESAKDPEMINPHVASWVPLSISWLSLHFQPL